MTQEEMKALKEAQEAFFATHVTIPVEWRKAQLKLLYGAIKNHEDEVLEALVQDLGKGKSEGYMVELGPLYEEIKYMLHNLKDLASPHYTCTPLHQFPGRSLTIAIPYGNVLIMSPWNYPFLLTMQPLVDAMAAGNTAVLKPSNYSAATTAVIRKIITETFPAEYITVVTGGHVENQQLLDLEWDYIFFTGSKNVGRIVMEKAAQHVTPVSLELGGKSPAVVDETSNLALAARRIVFGKFLNAGQTCVAPDYVYVQESVKEDFLKLLLHETATQYPKDSMIGKIITEKHFQRLCGLIDPDKVIYGGTASEPTRQIAPTIMDNVSWDDPIMQEEIFGPILPVLTFTDFKETMEEIASRPTPLAFYLFTRDKNRKGYYKTVQPFGSGCINDTIMQLANDHLPFGGMGASGIGQYHGKYGFQTFSHTKGILEKSDWIDIPYRYRNAPKWMDVLIHMYLK